MAELVPIFPLDAVLLPGTALPLHIFEPRYRELVADVCADGGVRAFGVVSVQPGAVPDSSISTGELHLARVGTMAEVIEVEPYPDGRSDLLAIGSRRFRLLSLEGAGKPYLCARIEWLPEHDGPIGGDQVLVAQALTRRYCLALARLVGGSRAADDLADDGLRLSYQVAGLLRLPSADRQRLLEAATAADRLLAAMLFMRRETALLTHTRTVPISPQTLRSAPTAN